MVNKYELPNETLRLIAGSPELSIPMMQQGGASRSDLICARCAAFLANRQILASLDMPTAQMARP